MINYCPNCGAQFTDREGMTQNFCPDCGIKLEFDFKKSPVEDFNLVTAYKSMFKKYAKFSGRSRRKEYWLASLANFIVAMCFWLVMVVLFMVEVAYDNHGEIVLMLTPFLMCLYYLVLIVPSLALTARRLHDTGKSAWFLLLQLIPYAGSIVIFIFTVLDSQPGTNKYGPNPKGNNGVQF